MGASGPWQYGGYHAVSAADRKVVLFLECVLIVGSCLVVGIFLYSAQFSGTIRWFLSVLLLLALAGIAGAYVLRRTREPSPLLVPPEEAGPTLGELSFLAATVRRAHGGLAFSQTLVASRARDAFAERARLALGLSLPAMHDVEADAKRLHALVHDPTLEDLLFLPSRDTKERYRWAEAARERGGFRAALAAVLDRMEAWR